MSLKDKRDLVIEKKAKLDNIINSEEKYELIKEITILLKDIYNTTGLYKDKIELIEIYFIKSSFEKNYEVLDDPIQNAFNTLRKAKRLVDELFLHNHNIVERKLVIECYYDYIKLGNKLKIKKINKNVFKLLYNSWFIYNSTKLVDDLKNIIRTYLLIADVKFDAKKYLISRYFYKKAFKKMGVLYEEFKYEGMREDIVVIVKCLLNTYKNKNNKGYLKWTNILKEYGGNYE